MGHLRVKGPVWARKSVDDVRASGGQLIVRGPGGRHDTPAPGSRAGFREEAQDIADRISVEGLPESASSPYIFEQ